MSLLYRAVGMLVEIIEFGILLRVLMSFLGIHSRNIITVIIYEITEPIMSLSRKLIEKTRIDTGFLDFTPVVAFVLMRVFYVILGSVLF